MALHGMLEDAFLALDRNVIDTNIGLSASTHGSNAAVFAVLGCQSNNRLVLQRTNQFGQRLTGLRNRWAGLEKNQVKNRRGVCRDFQ